MKCAVHQDVDATGYCRNCGKPLCALCVRPVRDVLYCEDCLASTMGFPHRRGALAQGRDPRRAPRRIAAVAAGTRGASPALAFFLGFLPGLGAFYNEQYGKA